MENKIILVIQPGQQGIDICRVKPANHLVKPVARTCHVAPDQRHDTALHITILQRSDQTLA